ncbi:MAG TPA: D-alanine--D-alanine ligase [Campylobacterales bacterium]|nr:D-alanine--D-alanine ligase [Campylobacterales bacterium]
MKIAIIFGAQSFEHEISIVSAIAMKDILKSEIVYIFCDEDREFYHIPASQIKSKLFSSGAYKKSSKLTVKNGGFYQKSLMKEKRVDFDVALNLSHGADGEDGKIASLLEFFEIPFIGPRVDASVMSFNKLFTKLYAKSLGVEVVDFEVLQIGAYKISLDYPVIIKPLRLGSSIGVSIVRDESELEYALDVAYEFDTEVLVEPFIESVKEYNLAGLKADEFIFSIVEEPQKEEFLDFDKKYLDFSRTSQVQEAGIDSYLEENLKLTFQKVYGSLFEGALIRCDFFVVDGKILLNEINPVPGSMANYLFSDFNAAIERLFKSLPKSKKIAIDYQYIHSIQKAKGK